MSIENESEKTIIENNEQETDEQTNNRYSHDKNSVSNSSFEEN